jgi:hypothetical protein
VRLIQTTKRLFPLVFVPTCVLFALASHNPVTRVAFDLALGAIALAIGLTHFVAPDRLDRITRICLVVMGASFLVLIVSALVGRGGALNGRVVDGHYFLVGADWRGQHGYREVTRARFFLAAAPEVAVVISWALGCTLAFLAEGRQKRGD